MGAEKQHVVTRFPPSPTGKLHIGNARTALFNYLFAKHHGGRILLRFEDTDRARSKKEYENDISNALEWLGFSFDAVYRQSERTEIYKQYLTDLLEKDLAYLSKEKNEAGEEREVVRFRNPNKSVTFTDIVRGEITFDTTELGDFIIARTIDNALYHFAVVVDDYEMGMTHIIRGEDHISNTPRQILIQEGIGAPRPQYAHLPLILAKDRSKLSKRGGSVATTDYREQGFLPAALVNYLALLGWNPGTDQELFTLDELIEQFDIMKIQRGGAVFDTEKLLWINKEHVRRLEPREFVRLAAQQIPERIRSLPQFSSLVFEKLCRVLQEKIQILCDVKRQFEQGEYDYFFSRPTYDTAGLFWNNEYNPEKTLENITETIRLLNAIPEKEFSETTIKEIMWPFATSVGRGFVLWPMRYALSGKEKSPDPFAIAAIIGKGKTMQRLGEAHRKLKTLTAEAAH